MPASPSHAAHESWRDSLSDLPAILLSAFISSFFSLSNNNKEFSAQGQRMESLYAGRAVALATMHSKERALERPFLRHLGAALRLADSVDTDALGTFTGEVKRARSAKATAIEKARLGMAATGLPLGIANEGSFGPHPQLFFASSDTEIVAFVDAERGFELCESFLSLRTNLAHADLGPDDDPGEFLARIGAPSHAVIVRPLDKAGDAKPVAKGLADPGQLIPAIRKAADLSPLGMARVETDMRAHMNPTRMAVIRAAASRLARRLRAVCPDCGAPGWGFVRAQRGLPCGVCGTPTELIRSIVEGCVACSSLRKSPRPDKMAHADPGQCPSCNP